MSDPSDLGRSSDEDRDAMSRLATGEDLALNEIMERWKDRVTAYLYRFTGNQSVAVDLAEETFVRLYQSRAKFRSSGVFSTWLFGIAANLGRNHHRWQRRHPTLPLEEAGELSSDGNPRASAEAHERGVAVQRAVTSLPDDLRETLILSEYEGLTQAEIAVVARCSVKAVERRLSRARALLRSTLSEYLRS